MASINPKISWLNDGEDADQLTLNRPLKEVVNLFDNRINHTETISADTNTFTISSLDTSKIDTDRMIVSVNGTVQDDNCYTKQVNSDNIVLTFQATLKKNTVVKVITQ